MGWGCACACATVPWVFSDRVRCFFKKNASNPVQFSDNTFGLQVTRIIKYIRLDLNEKESARMPKVLRDVAQKESRRVRENAKNHIRSIRSSRKGKSPDKGGAPPPAAFSDPDGADGYLTLRSDDEVEQHGWLGEVVVDDGDEVTGAEIDAANERIQQGETISGRELRAVLTRFRDVFLEDFAAEQGPLIERTRLHAQTKTKQMMVQKMGEMRKQNRRKTQMLSALDDTLGPDDTWALASSDPSSKGQAAPSSPDPPAPHSPPPDFSEPSPPGRDEQPAAAAAVATSSPTPTASNDTIVPQGPPPTKTPLPPEVVCRSSESQNLPPPPQDFEDNEAPLPPPPLLEGSGTVDIPSPLPLPLALPVLLPEPSPMVIESPVPGGGPKFFPASDEVDGVVTVDGQAVTMRPRRKTPNEENGGRRSVPPKQAASFALFHSGPLCAQATFKPLQLIPRAFVCRRSSDFHRMSNV
jgi:hypothetical protein